MKNILYISAFQPSLKMEAGHKTTYQQLEALAKYYQIDLIIIQRRGPFVREPIYRELNTVHFIKLSFYDYPVILFLSILKIIPVRYLSRFSLKLIFILKKIDLSKYEFIQLDFTQVFWLTFILPKNIKIKLLCSDILTQFASRHNFLNKFFLGRFFYYEKLFFQRANEIILLCQKDLNIVESFFGIDSKKLTIIPPALSHFVLDFERDNSLVEEKTLLFWGSMSRPENYNAILNFINLIFIKLLKLDSEIKLYIVGSNPNKSLLKISKEFPRNIIVTGFVDNPKEYFQRATLGIAPIISGAGIKVKVLEMLKCQIPVFSTAIGAEGIKKQKNLKVLSSVDCFYDEIKKFMNLNGAGIKSG